MANPFVLVNEYLVLSPVLLQYLISLSLISKDCLNLPLATSNRITSLHLNNTSVNRLLLRLQQVLCHYSRFDRCNCWISYSTFCSAKTSAEDIIILILLRCVLLRLVRAFLNKILGRINTVTSYRFIFISSLSSNYNPNRQPSESILIYFIISTLLWGNFISFLWFWLSPLSLSLFHIFVRQFCQLFWLFPPKFFIFWLSPPTLVDSFSVSLFSFGIDQLFLLHHHNFIWFSFWGGWVFSLGFHFTCLYYYHYSK